MSRASRLVPGSRWSEVSVVLEDEAGIRELNARFLSCPEPTDVISFRFEPFPGGPGAPGGEIVVNVECALRLGAAGRNRSPSRELALYLAHGCDHLAGQRDDTAEGRARMRRRELRWLRRAEELGLIEGLILP